VTGPRIPEESIEWQKDNNDSYKKWESLFKDGRKSVQKEFNME